MNGPTFAPAPAAVATPRPAPVRHTPTAKPALKLDAEGGGGLRVLTYLRLHWLMIAFCGTLLGSGGAYAAWELLPSKYESYALLQVSSVPFALANQSNVGQAKTDFVTYVKTNTALMKSEFVLNAALRDIKDLQSIREQKDPIKYLDEEVMVSWKDGSEVVQLNCKGHNPGDVKRIVDSVQKAFMAEVINKDITELRARLGSIEEHKQAFQKILERKVPHADRAVNAGQPAVVAAGGPVQPGVGAVPAAGIMGQPAPLPPLAPGGAAPGQLLPPVVAANNPTDPWLKLKPELLLTRVLKLQAEVHDDIPAQIQIARKRVESATAKVNAARLTKLSPAIAGMVDHDHEVQAQMASSTRAKRQYESARSIGSENAPDVVTLQKIAAALESSLVQMRQKKLELMEGNLRAEEEKKYAPELDAARDALAALGDRLARAQFQLAQAERQFAEYPPPVEKVNGVERAAGGKQYDALWTDISRTDDIFSRLITQEHMVRLELESPPRVHVLQTASQPTQKDTRKQILGTVFAGLMGYIAIAMGVIGFETMSRKVSGLSDLKSSTPAAVVGIIPCLPSEATGTDPAKRAAANEGIDKLRGYVAQSWLSRGADECGRHQPARR